MSTNYKFIKSCYNFYTYTQVRCVRHDSRCFIDTGEILRLTCKRIMVSLCLLNASVNVLEISHCSVNFCKKIK